MARPVTDLVLGSLPVPQADPEAARRAAREILARPEFRPEPRPLLDRVLAWIGDLVGQLLGAIAGGGSAAVVAVVMVVVALAVLAWAIGRLVRTMSWRSGAAAAESDDDTGRSPRDWQADADAAERAGDWRQAVRCRYRALVADLHARGLLEEVPGRTSGEYRREVATTLPAGSPPFSAASDTFDRVFYGGRRAGPDDAAAVRAATADVLRAAA